MGSVEVDTVGGISDRRGCRAVYSRLSESPTVACRAAIGNADTHSGADYLKVISRASVSPMMIRSSPRSIASSRLFAAEPTISSVSSSQ